MKLIIGLGNIGPEYQNTRHNFGFMALDVINTDWQESKKAQCLYAKIQLGNQLVELLKPTTFMNNSGLTLAYALKKHNLKPSDCVVIYDDIDLPLGTIRSGVFTSSAGHNGIKSILAATNNDPSFFRIRLGIKNETSEKISTEKFVLQKFTKFEIKTVDKVITQTKTLLEEMFTKADLPKTQQTISVI